jgi:hypothetical protein
MLKLKVNGFNSPMNRHSLANWFKKEDPTSAAYRRSITLTEISTG